MSEPVERPVKQRNMSEEGATDWYVDITCPHCGDTFEATHSSASKNKSHACKAHLAKKKCHIPEEERADDVSTALALPESKRARMSVVKHEACNRRFGELEQRIGSLEKDRDAFVGNLITGFPALQRPITSDNVVPKLQVVMQCTALANIATSTTPPVHGVPMLNDHTQSADSLTYMHKYMAVVREQAELTEALKAANEALQAEKEATIRMEKLYREELTNVKRLTRRCFKLATDKEYRLEFRGMMPPQRHDDLGVSSRSRAGTPVPE